MTTTLPRDTLRIREADGLTVSTVREALDSRASDPDIAAYAAANDWVILSSDDDFFDIPGAFGHRQYNQRGEPAVGDVLTAIRRIRDAYDNHCEIVEVVPDGWV